MVGSTYIQGSQPVEYVEESTFATAEVDATWSWIGLVNSFSATEMVEEEVVKYLPDDSNAIDLQTLTAEKVSELHEVEVTYHPQNNTFFQYFTGADGSLSNTLTSLQFGTQDGNNGEFRRLLGCVGEELTLEISEDSVAEVTASFIAADVTDDTSTDYVGIGAHASEDSSAPFSYDDLGSVQWGGSALSGAIESLTLTVSNDLAVVKDPDATASSHVDAIVPVDREITVEMSVTYDDFSLMDDVRSFTKNNLTFDFPDSGTSVSWTVNDVAFPEAPYEYTPDDLIADSLSSVPATGLTYS